MHLLYCVCHFAFEVCLSVTRILTFSESDQAESDSMSLAVTLTMLTVLSSDIVTVSQCDTTATTTETESLSLSQTVSLIVIVILTVIACTVSGRFGLLPVRPPPVRSLTRSAPYPFGPLIYNAPPGLSVTESASSERYPFAPLPWYIQLYYRPSTTTLNRETQLQVAENYLS